MGLIATYALPLVSINVHWRECTPLRVRNVYVFGIGTPRTKNRFTGSWLTFHPRFNSFLEYYNEQLYRYLRPKIHHPFHNTWWRYAYYYNGCVRMTPLSDRPKSVFGIIVVISIIYKYTENHIKIARSHPLDPDPYAVRAVWLFDMRLELGKIEIQTIRDLNIIWPTALINNEVLVLANR